jgi:hypothetical protein
MSHVERSNKLAKFASNSLNKIVPHPWWDKLCIKMGEARYEDDGTGNVRRIGNTFESRSAAMVLNYPERVESLRLEQERKDRELHQAEAERRERHGMEEPIIHAMLTCGGYLDDAFDPNVDYLKSDVVKEFIKNNMLKQRPDFIEFCQQMDPPREVRQELLLPQAIQYLETLLNFNAQLDDDSDDRIQWE